MCFNMDVYWILHILLFETILISTTQKKKFTIKDFFSNCDQNRSFQRVWSHLLKKSLIENFIFCAEFISNYVQTLRIGYIPKYHFSAMTIPQTYGSRVIGTVGLRNTNSRSWISFTLNFLLGSFCSTFVSRAVSF